MLWIFLGLAWFASVIAVVQDGIADRMDQSEEVIITRDTTRYFRISSANLDDVIWSPKGYHTSQYDTRERSLVLFLFSTVPADGLAPNGARPSAGEGMTKFESCLYTRLALKALKHLQLIQL